MLLVRRLNILTLFGVLCAMATASAFSLTAPEHENAVVDVDGRNARSVRNMNSNLSRECPAASATVRNNVVSDELFNRARLSGSVRIIVQLRIANGSDDNREQRIYAAQQGLLGELAAVAHRVVRSFTAVPTIVIEASYAALQVLDRSSYVLRVDDDGLAAPMSTLPD